MTAMTKHTPFASAFLSVAAVIVIGHTFVATTRAADGPAIEGQRLHLAMREDLSGLASVVDCRTGREYVAAADQPVALYRLTIGHSAGDAQTATSLEASRRWCKRIDNGLELHFEHNEKARLNVACRVTAASDDPKIRWRISVTNHGSQPVIGVEYPIVHGPIRLGDDSTDDAIAYPHLEGVLLANPAVNMTRGMAMADSYPGTLSAQFLYYFDPAGGLYVAAEDGNGHRKSLKVQRLGRGLSFSVHHDFPSRLAESVEPPYEVVWTTGGGRWEDGAEVYRHWAAEQPWCARKIAESEIPVWLRQPVVFLNYNVRQAGSDAYDTVEAADRNLKRYRDFFDVPVVACAFGWERHGTWIGPDYFPPHPSEAYYIELSKRLAARGDHLHVFTSGFRWGVKKPVRETRDRSKPRVYTNYDGTEHFERVGRGAAVVRPDGRLDFQKPPWADNYTLCAGSQQARRILTDAFCRVYSWGVAGVDLDQNLGAACSPCWNEAHAHPPGAGHWQFAAMSGFLQDLRRKARPLNPHCFLGIEEPCECYIPWIDIYHGRAFTATRWPANGPGAVSIPLYIYLYHTYQPGYAGWIDGVFSPASNVRYGLARAFLFGMQPGVRIPGKPFDLTDGPASEEMEMLRRLVKLNQQMGEYLLLGQMLPAPNVTGSPAMTRVPLPIRWPVVQATAWRCDSGNVCYAVANLSGQSQTVELEVAEQGMATSAVRLAKVGPDKRAALANSTTLPTDVRLVLGPWELLCVEQTRAEQSAMVNE
jgi:hypothetical protein